MKGLPILVFCFILHLTAWANCSVFEIPTISGSYQATNSCVDGAWTHYFHEVGAKNLLLFSVKTTTVASFDPANIQVVIPDNGITRLSNAPYVVSGAPWVVLNKYWEATPNETMPLANNITIRVYFNENDFNLIKNEINNTYNGNLNTTDDLIFYGFKSGFGINPDPTTSNPHTNADENSFVQCNSITGVLQGNIYYAEISMDNFIGGGIGGSTFGGVLPIELVNFNLEEENKEVELSWTTLSEIDNDYFSVLHSISGLDFREISRVPGAGNSSSAKSYAYFHETPAVGDNYYRLKQIDFNGVESISEIKVIKFRGTKYIDITPTLALENIRIDIPFQFDYGATIKIFDSHGRVVYSGLFSPREQRKYVEVSSLAPGLYQIKVSDGDIFLSKAFMKSAK